MKYIGMPFAVWQFFGWSFEKNLPAVFGISKADAKSTMAKAKEKYEEIIGKLPKFEKGDRFQMNIVGCAMLAAVVTSTAIAATKREWRGINNACKNYNCIPILPFLLVLLLSRHRHGQEKPYRASFLSR